MRSQKGFSYVIVMFLVAAVSIVSVRAMENTMTTLRREKEAELLYVGQIYLNAIRSYYENSPGTAKQYPVKGTTDAFDALIFDGRNTKSIRHLRKRFRDPITGSRDWGVVYDGAAVIGVYSTSTQKPIKRDGFSEQLASFKDAATYADWRFIYRPPVPGQPVPPASPTTPAP